MWGSTYCCEQFFSCMKNVKTAERKRLTDQHLANILRIKTTAIDTNIDKIVAGDKISCNIAIDTNIDKIVAGK